MVNGLSMENVPSSVAIQTLKTCGKIANIVSVLCGGGWHHAHAVPVPIPDPLSTHTQSLGQGHLLSETAVSTILSCLLCTCRR